jgi:hypothetical protein
VYVCCCTLYKLTKLHCTYNIVSVSLQQSKSQGRLEVSYPSHNAALTVTDCRLHPLISSDDCVTYIHTQPHKPTAEWSRYLIWCISTQLTQTTPTTYTSPSHSFFDFVGDQPQPQCWPRESQDTPPSISMTQTHRTPSVCTQTRW